MKNKNSLLFKLLYKKRFTVAFSVVVAFILWLVIMISQNPEIERSFTDISLKVNLENTYVSKNGMEIIGDISTQKFTVTVNGPSYVVSALTPSDFYVYASAAQVNEPGEYELAVSGTKNNTAADYEITSITPKKVKINFDYVDKKEFTLTAQAAGAVASKGLITDTPVVSGIDGDTITVEGARTIISKIDSVVAYAEVNDTLKTSKTFDAEIRLYDKKGKQLPKDELKISINDADVKVTVPIAMSATVKVVPSFSNLPDKFDQSSLHYTIDHKSVKVIGTPDAMKKLKKITLSPIDLTALSQKTTRFKVTATLPEGVRLLDNIEDFVVNVDLTDYAEKTVTVSKFKSTNLSSGLKAKMVSAIKNVTICGRKDVLDALDEGQLYAVADLKEKAAGEYTVEVIIQSDTVHTVWQVGTCEAAVKIQ